MILTHTMFDLCLYENVFLFRNIEKDAWTVDVNILPPLHLYVGHIHLIKYTVHTLYIL